VFGAEKRKEIQRDEKCGRAEKGEADLVRTKLGNVPPSNHHFFSLFPFPVP